MESINKRLKGLTGGGRRNLRNLGLLAFIAVLWVICSLLSPFFFQKSNIMLLLRQCATIMIGGTGMTFVILTGGTDLSVGSIAALSGMLTGIAITSWSWPASAALLLGLVVGVVFGSFNGLLISRFNLQPMVCTLGTSSIAKGLTLLSTSGRSLFVTNATMMRIGNGYFLEFPVPVVIAFIIFLLGYVVLNFTLLGRNLYSIGGNEEATRLSGVNTWSVKTVAYAVSGFCAAAVGLILVCTLGASEPTVGADLALDSIAVSAIGGVSLFGGVGSLVGTVLGAILIGTIKNGLTMLNIVSYYQQLILGFVIIFAVLLEQIKKK